MLSSQVFSTVLILLCSCMSRAQTENAKIVQSAVEMTLRWQADSIMAVSQIYQVETVNAAYLQTLVEAQGLRADESLIDFQVNIIDENLQQDETVLQGHVQVLYLTPTMPLSLNTTLSALTQQDGLLGLARALESVVGISTKESISMTFSTDQERLDLGSVVFDPSSTKNSAGLILTVAILAFMLLIVSNVLLYITGAWKVCRQKCNSCLFEEVDDEYAVAKMATFQVQSYDEGEQTNESKSNGQDNYDNANINDDIEIQSVVTDNPDGMLGGDERIAGLGIQTPMRGGDADDMSTTMSEYQTTPVPLGIHSMRKLPPPDSPDVKGGLSHMVMQRLTAPYHHK